MSWAKVQKGRKPFRWWWHKVFCEIGWHLRNHTGFGWKMYYHHLNGCCRAGFNLYGKKII